MMTLHIRLLKIGIGLECCHSSSFTHAWGLEVHGILIVMASFSGLSIVDHRFRTMYRMRGDCGKGIEKQAIGL
jgi:hypothetical protein